MCISKSPTLSAGCSFITAYWGVEEPTAEDYGEADNIDFGPVEMMIDGLDDESRPENEPF
jgi:hypothetical protein